MPVEAIFDSRLSANDMRVLAILIFRSNPNPDNICWPSIKDISYQTGIAENKIPGHTKRLANFGWIEKKTKGNGGVKHNQIYHVLSPPTSGGVKPPPFRESNPPHFGSETPPTLGVHTPIKEIIKGNDKKKLGNSSKNFSVKKRSSKEDEKTAKLIMKLQKKWEESKTPEYANA